MQNIIENSTKYLKEVKAELKKVTWTGRKEVTSGSIAVMILSIVISLFLSIVDIGLSKIVHLIVKW